MVRYKDDVGKASPTVFAKSSRLIVSFSERNQHLRTFRDCEHPVIIRTDNTSIVFSSAWTHSSRETRARLSCKTH